MLDKHIAALYERLRAEICPSEIRSLKEQAHTLTQAVRLSGEQRLHIIKVCSCGRAYSLNEWLSLPLVGYQSTEWFGGELRNCDCKSTLMAVARRTPLKQPKAKILQHTIMDPLTDSVKNPFTLSEALNLGAANAATKGNVHFCDWEDQQIEVAALTGKPPEWAKDRNGKMIPIYG